MWQKSRPCTGKAAGGPSGFVLLTAATSLTARRGGPCKAEGSWRPEGPPATVFGPGPLRKLAFDNPSLSGGIVLGRFAPCAFPFRSPRGPLQSTRKHFRHFVVLVLFHCPVLTRASSRRTVQQKSTAALLRCFLPICGECGIRTPEPFRINSFQDCRHQPLGQLSFP